MGCLVGDKAKHKRGKIGYAYGTHAKQLIPNTAFWKN